MLVWFLNGRVKTGHRTVDFYIKKGRKSGSSDTDRIKPRIRDPRLANDFQDLSDYFLKLIQKGPIRLIKFSVLCKILNLANNFEGKSQDPRLTMIFSITT